jgi:DNA-binding winged helix-turn-helix (wHTH) protein/predicted ATPase
MHPERVLSFPPFHLDVDNEQLRRDDTIVPLRPKAFVVLRYLAEHSGRLVSRDELVQAVWGETKVSEVVLRGCLHEIRRALGDAVASPHFIETVPRRGWQFIAPVTTSPQPVSSVKFQAPIPPSTSGIVGRAAELARLHQWLAQAQGGKRQLVFVTGEPGMGKTTLVDAFIAQVARDPAIWVARGQCIEHYGAGAAYLPVLEALERLCHQADGERVIALLRRYAPLWLAQLSSIVDPVEQAELQRQAAGTTQERMLRELAALLEVLTAETPLVLVLEDVHWSDASTLALLAMLARRREAARLLVIGTYRPMEVLTTEHPLRAVTQELLGHGLCQVLALEGVTQAAIAEYLQSQFAGGAPLAASLHRLAHVLHRRTEGHPLFVVTLVEELIAREVLRHEDGAWAIRGAVEDSLAEVPESIRQLLARQVERLAPAAQQVLEAASVAGAEFSAAAVSAALDADVTQVEEQCEEFARRQQFVQRAGIEEWPDQTMTARYGFRHALYQQLWHERVTPSRQQQYHMRIGRRKEHAYTGRTQEIAAELAVHFEQGREYGRAVLYHRQAAEVALRRSAPAEALRHVTTAVALLRMLPETRARTQQELDLYLLLGSLQMATQGYATPEMGQAYTRARALCDHMGQPPHHLFYALLGLFAFHLMRTELGRAYALAEQLATVAHALQEPALCAEAALALGAAEFHRGELVQAHAHFERGITFPPPPSPDAHLVDFGQDPWVACLSYDAFALALLGYLEQAQQQLRHAYARAQRLAHPFSLAFCLEVCCHLAHFRGEPRAAEEHAQAVTALATEYGFRQREASGTIYRGWALTAQRQTKTGLAQLRHGLAAYRAVKATLLQPLFLALLVEAASRGRHVAEGLAAVTEALDLAQRAGERFYEAELYRLKGQLRLQAAVHSWGSTVKERRGASVAHPHPAVRMRQVEAEADAEGSFRTAITIARKQQAKLLELRATMSLARLWQQQGKQAEARQLLAEIYGWFTEGFDTKDLQEAKALLEALS